MKRMTWQTARSLLSIGTAAALSFSLTISIAAASAEDAKKKGLQNAPVAQHPHSSLVNWVNWSNDLFERAKKENKLVILDLEAIWCHWCHVMDAKTYSDPAVAKILTSKYICVKVDQDSRPDLSNRYEQYGWPATVVFRPSGEEIEIRSGYIPPEKMKVMLDSCVKHPHRSPKEKPISASDITFAKDGVLSATMRKELLDKHINGYDTENGGWGFDQKFLDWDTVEYAISRAAAGDKNSEKRAKETFKCQRKLIDPVWGGVYQYSTHGDWDHPHFEKIMQMQGENMRVFALAYSMWHDPADLKAAQDIEKFLRTFLLSPDGAFYTSMDADLVQGEHSGDYFALDDSGRRKRGIPRVDKHIYSRENGWAITGLVQLYMASQNADYLKEADRAANWIISNRSLPNGGFRHDADDKAGPYLSDTLAMGRAFLALYTATADRQWLTRARDAANFINVHFAEATNGGKGAGFATADLSQKNIHAPVPLLDENVMVARFANLLNKYTGDEKYQKMAREAMRFLATPEIARTRQILVAGMLLADEELSNDPAHITIVGKKDDAAARSLFESALLYPSGYKRIEWWDKGDGPLPNADVEYPEMPKAAAFLCINGRCSAPVYKPDAIAGMIEQSQRKQ